MKKIFAITDEKVNTGRQIEIDIARGLAVLFMIFVHVQIYYSSDELKDSVFGGLVDFFGGIPAAPVFMFLMGCGFMYTRKNNPQHFFKRGLYILVAAYVLNILRDSLPNLVDYFINREADMLSEALDNLILIDILQFAGIAMIFWSAVLNFKLQRYLPLFLVGFGILNLILLPYEFDEYIPSAILGLFWGTSDVSEFPFLTWIFYPIIGYIFAGFLVKCTNKNRFYTILFIISSVLMITFCLTFISLNLDLGLTTEESYYHHTIFANIVYAFFVIAWLSVVYFVAKIFPNWLISLFKVWSRNVTEIYFIHWILIGWLGIFLDENTMDILLYLFTTIAIFTVSDLLSRFLDKRGIRLM